MLRKKLHSLCSDIEDLWMSELYFEQREYEKSHLLFPSEK